jgi:hypothetical protein
VEGASGTRGADHGSVEADSWPCSSSCWLIGQLNSSIHSEWRFQAHGTSYPIFFKKNENPISEYHFF